MDNNTIERKKYTLKDLIKLTKNIKDEKIKNAVLDFIKNPLPTHNEIENTNITIENSPASIRWHHKYEGGLIEHIISVAKLSLNIAQGLEEVYDLDINKDLLIAGAILHDIMKPFNYTKNEEDNSYDHISNFTLEHLTLMVAEMYKRNIPMDLIKLVATHHGEHGAMRPDSIEGWILHYADNIDASLNDIAIRICQSRAKDIGIEEKELYTKFTPLKIYEMRTKKGKEELINYLNDVFNNNVDDKEKE